MKVEGDRVTQEFEHWPLGARWPWLPRYSGKMRQLPLKIDKLDPGESVGVGVEFEIVGEVTRGRIGLRRWARWHWDRFRVVTGIGFSE